MEDEKNFLEAEKYDGPSTTLRVYFFGFRSYSQKGKKSLREKVIVPLAAQDDDASAV